MFWGESDLIALLYLVGKMKKYFLLVFLLVAVSGCASLTTKSVSSLKKYKDKPVSEFIHNRYITKHDTFLVGSLFKGLDFVGDKVQKIKPKNNEIDEANFFKKFSIFEANYNLSNYSLLTQPKRELSNLCTVKGGELKVRSSFNINIPSIGLNERFGSRFKSLAAEYKGAEESAQKFNKQGNRIHVTDGLSIPVFTTTDEIRSTILSEMGKLQQFNELRKSSNIQVALSNDMGVAGERAFDMAIQEQAFGVFACEGVNGEKWKVSITPLWNRVKQQQMVNSAMLQILSDDKIQMSN